VQRAKTQTLPLITQIKLISAAGSSLRKERSGACLLIASILAFLAIALIRVHPW
jgi:hypothetical protein